MERDVFMKFFPDSWRADEQLGICSFAARGLWIELMAVAHKSGGYVLINGRSPSLDELAQAVRGKPKDVKVLLAELHANGVCSIKEDGTIYSRRMVRDAIRRRQNRANGRKGGNPGLIPVEPNSDNQPVIQKSSYSSSDLGLGSGSSEEDDLRVSDTPPAWRRPEAKTGLMADDAYHKRNCAPWAYAACRAGVCIPKYLWPKWQKRKSVPELKVFVEKWTPRFTAGDAEEKFWPAAFEAEFGTSRPSPPARDKATQANDAMHEALAIINADFKKAIGDGTH